MNSTNDERWLDAGSIADFEDGKFKKISVGLQEGGVVRIEDAYYAVRNVCPHAFGPICHGPVEHSLTGGVGKPEIEKHRPVVACPWHGWEFDLRDGKCVSDPSWSVRTFRVETRDGRVMVKY